MNYKKQHLIKLKVWVSLALLMSLINPLNQS